MRSIPCAYLRCVVLLHVHTHTRAHYPKVGCRPRPFKYSYFIGLHIHLYTYIHTYVCNDATHTAPKRNRSLSLVSSWCKRFLKNPKKIIVRAVKQYGTHNVNDKDEKNAANAASTTKRVWFESSSHTRTVLSLCLSVLSSMCMMCACVLHGFKLSSYKQHKQHSQQHTKQ